MQYGLSWREHLAAIPIGVFAVSVGFLIARQRLDTPGAVIGGVLLTYLVGAVLITVYKVGKNAGRRSSS